MQTLEKKLVNENFTVVLQKDGVEDNLNYQVRIVAQDGQAVLFMANRTPIHSLEEAEKLFKEAVQTLTNNWRVLDCPEE